MTILNRWFEEVWNQGNEAAIDELSHFDARAYGIGPNVDGISNLHEFRAFYHQFRAAFSDIHVAVEATITEGDLTVARCVVTARHTGEGLGKPPKGNPVKFTGMTMARLKDGKVAEAWNNYDFMTMFQQMD